MNNRAAGLLLTLAVLLGTPLQAQFAPSSDPGLTQGVAQIRAGDFQGALLTLDTLVNRLSSEPGRSKDLAQAYVYLGYAHAGLNQDTQAKVKFQNALAHDPSLRLGTEEFPPKVIRLFGEARAQAGLPEAAQAPKAAAPQKGAPATSQGGGGGKKILLGVGALAVVGGALVATGVLGSGDVTDTFTGTLSPFEEAEHAFTMGKAGTVTARYEMVSPAGADIDIWLCPPPIDAPCQVTNFFGGSLQPLMASLAAGSWVVVADNDASFSVQYVLKVTHPAP